MSNITITANELSNSESLTDSCPTPRFSAMSAHSSVKGTPTHIREWLISLRPDSLASHLARQASGWEPTMNVTCGLQRLSALGELDPDTSSVKTLQDFLFLDTLKRSSATLPKSGMTCNGIVYRLGRSVHGMRETECGYRQWVDKREKMPTPAHRDYRSGKHNNDKSRDQLNEYTGGLLNPEWVEWLMGWPIGWTSLEPLSKTTVDEWKKNIHSYWREEPDIPRTVPPRTLTDRASRIKALGNGQVSLCAAVAMGILLRSERP
jgi:hypothetical protein